MKPKDSCKEEDVIITEEKLASVSLTTEDKEYRMDKNR